MAVRALVDDGVDSPALAADWGRRNAPPAFVETIPTTKQTAALVRSVLVPT